MPPCSRCTCWRLLVFFFALGSLLLLLLQPFFANVIIEVEKMENMKRIQSLQPLALRELDDVEQLILLPPHGLRIDHTFDYNREYLNSSSSLARSIFFPTTDAFHPRKDDGYFYPGKIWLDTDGNPIQAHGGGILLDHKSGVYYWYGEYKNGPTYKTTPAAAARVDFIGVACYSSTDLLSWKYEGIVLAAQEENHSHDLYKTKVLERPKVVYNDLTEKYVMWMHIDDESYGKAAVGVAISDSPTGPFEYLHSFRPNGHDSRDMTVFKDDDGTAYLVYSSNRNKEIHISPMSRDFLSVENATVRAMAGQYREAPAVFKHNNVYYMVTSGCSGWAPNEALVHEAESMFGPWESIGNPCVGANKVFRVATFFSQGTFVIPMPGGDPGSFVFMADRWKPDDLGDSRYVWLPLVVNSRSLRYRGLPLWSSVSIFWHGQWRIEDNGKVHAHIDEW